MCRQMTAYIKEHPGATLEEVLGAIKTGQKYGVFGSSKLARDGIIKMVKLGCLKDIKIKSVKHARVVAQKHQIISIATFTQTRR